MQPAIADFFLCVKVSAKSQGVSTSSDVCGAAINYGRVPKGSNGHSLSLWMGALYKVAESVLQGDRLGQSCNESASY